MVIIPLVRAHAQPRFAQLESSLWAASQAGSQPSQMTPQAASQPPSNPIQQSQATIPNPVQGTKGRSGPPTCDITFEGTLCFNDGQSVVVPPARHYGLILHLDMESSRPIDVSGLGHHAAGDLYASPGLTGTGHSALFRNTFVDVPRSPIMDELGVGNFSLTFFISVLEDAVTVASRAALEPNTLWCPSEVC